MFAGDDIGGKCEGFERRNCRSAAANDYWLHFVFVDYRGSNETKRELSWKWSLVDGSSGCGLAVTVAERERSTHELKQHNLSEEIESLFL